MPRDSWVCIVFTGLPRARAASSGDFSSRRHSLHTGRYGSRSPSIAAVISAALARRGYSWSDINDALRRYGAETGEDY